MKRLLGGLLIAGILANPLFAGSASGRIGIGGVGGWDDLYARDKDRRQTNGDLFWSGWVRLGLSEKNELALGYDSLQFEVKNNSNATGLRVRPVTMSLWHSFSPNKKVTPLLTLGAGAADISWSSPEGRINKTVFAAQGGAGLEYFPVSFMSLGALARVHYITNNSMHYNTEATAYSLGLMANLFWGGEPAAPKEVKVVPTPVVEETPPPAPVVVEPVLPKDSDNDGILDDADKCPGTPAGTLVNADGCPVERVSVTLDVKFDSGKATLTPESTPQLDKAADFLKRYADTNVLIEGHTDNRGSAEQNKVLSQKRAEAVKAALVERGVEAGRISAKGFSSTVPLMDNATPEGRAANRRVVATVSALKK